SGAAGGLEPLRPGVASPPRGVCCSTAVGQCLAAPPDDGRRRRGRPVLLPRWLPWVPRGAARSLPCLADLATPRPAGTPQAPGHGASPGAGRRPGEQEKAAGPSPGARRPGTRRGHTLGGARAREQPELAGTSPPDPAAGVGSSGPQEWELREGSPPEAAARGLLAGLRQLRPAAQACACAVACSGTTGHGTDPAP